MRVRFALFSLNQYQLNSINYNELLKKVDGITQHTKPVLHLLISGIIFSAYGQSWRELRRFTIQALRDFGVGKTSLEEKILNEVDALTTYLKNTDGKPLVFNRPIQKLVGNVIFGIVFGRR